MSQECRLAAVLSKKQKDTMASLDEIHFKIQFKVQSNFIVYPHITNDVFYSSKSGPCHVIVIHFVWMQLIINMQFFFGQRLN